jgi:hypothetical protein
VIRPAATTRSIVIEREMPRVAMRLCRMPAERRNRLPNPFMTTRMAPILLRALERRPVPGSTVAALTVVISPLGWRSILMHHLTPHYERNCTYSPISRPGAR